MLMVVLLLSFIVSVCLKSVYTKPAVFERRSISKQEPFRKDDTFLIQLVSEMSLKVPALKSPKTNKY